MINTLVKIGKSVLNTQKISRERPIPTGMSENYVESLLYQIYEKGGIMSLHKFPKKDHLHKVSPRDAILKLAKLGYVHIKKYSGTKHPYVYLNVMPKYHTPRHEQPSAWGQT